jgi:hypothetical protein
MTGDLSRIDHVSSETHLHLIAAAWRTPIRASCAAGTGCEPEGHARGSLARQSLALVRSARTVADLAGNGKTRPFRPAGHLLTPASHPFRPAGRSFHPAGHPFGSAGKLLTPASQI